LHGRIKRHHRFLLRLHLQQIDALDADCLAVSMFSRLVTVRVAASWL
jgi:hypothetical protein